MFTKSVFQECLESVERGDVRVYEQLMAACESAIIDIARRNMIPAARRLYSPEDFPALVLASVFKCSQEKSSELKQISDPWRYVLRVAKQKVAEENRNAGAAMRGGPLEGQRSWIHHVSRGYGSWDELAACPMVVGDLQCIVASAKELLNRLDDPELRQVALARLEGKTFAEIAKEMNCSERTVQRRVAVIQSRWNDGNEDVSRGETTDGER